MNTSKLHIYTDFNSDALRRILSSRHKIESTQVNHTLGIVATIEASNNINNSCFVWYNIESIMKMFSINHDESSHVPLAEDIVSSIYKVALALIDSYKFVYFCAISHGREGRKIGISPYSPHGSSYICAKLNTSLSELSHAKSNFILFDTQAWKDKCKKSLDDKYWYLTKCPYSIEIQREAASWLAMSISLTSNGRRCKVILLDLDNTIWGGEVGENSWESLRLGGHDHIGEAFKEFQERLLELNKQGIIIALLSKNTEQIALDAFNNHPEMVLKLENIATHRINFLPKHKNAQDVLSELNIDAASAVFLDDNAGERGLMREFMPDILVPDLPPDPCQYSSFLYSITQFNSLILTEDDSLRANSYTENKNRYRIKSSYHSSSDWIESLETRIDVSALNSYNRSRYVQLLNKTNQYNLKTRRLDSESFNLWADEDCNHAYVLSLKDKHGKMGIIALLSYTVTQEALQVEDFVLSCRAAERNIEETMVYILAQHSRKYAVGRINLQAVTTSRNAPLMRFMNSSKNIQCIDDTSYFIDSIREITCPKGISIFDL